MDLRTEQIMELGPAKVLELEAVEKGEITSPTVQAKTQGIKFPEHHIPNYPTRRVAGNPDSTMEG